MANYKTPGVYIEEIVKFPPSVAQVETAIPAFIGYTEKAKKKEAGDLIMNPVRISSMLEYETFFGYAEPETTIGVNIINAGLNNQEVVVSQPTSPSHFKMYYNMQMYFANGGGPCYIIAVGTYTTSKTNNSIAPVILQEVGNNGFKGLMDGLNRLEMLDEPTLIVFPDATSLISDSDFYGLYEGALKQCNKLQDRFTIIDTYRDQEYDDGSGDVNPVEALRSKISLEKDFLKYGASYYPFLETILDYAYNEANVSVTGIEESLSNIADGVIDGIDLSELSSLLLALVTTKDNIDLATPSTAISFKPTVIRNTQDIFNFLNNIKDNINGLIDKANAVEGSALDPTSNNMTVWMDTNLEATLSSLSGLIFKLNEDDSQTKLMNTLQNNSTNIFALLGLTDEVDMTNNGIYTSLEGQITANELFLFHEAIVDLGVVNVPTLAQLKDANNALYNLIKAEIGLLPIKLAPSATMAGVYARVDSTRGVWKAPANVGLSYVVKPSVQISHEAQMALNVDVTAGKSVNAIRAFVGKGNLVWGARTLAGNDNEWRYISVRRFFNMAEESIKKATEQFVFEPNDKNTWVRVKAMIDNFLTQQWKAGALAGSTPDKAFYVKVGLGETMTALDVLEGNLIIEIGMAAVRPAEFIILKFSHKMQEA